MRKMLLHRFENWVKNGAVERGGVAAKVFYGNRSRKLRPTLFWIRVQK